MSTVELPPCPTCGTPLGPGAKFCAECGHRVDAPVAPEPPADLPVDEPHEEAPVAAYEAEPQYFGVGAPLLVFSVAVVLFVVGVVLLGLGSVALGLVLLVLAFLLLPAFLAGARRWPDSRLARLSLSTAQRARGEAGVAADAISTWTRAGRETVRLRREQFRVRRELDEQLLALGRLVLDGDERVPEATTEARALDERLRRCDEELERVLDGARRHVRDERATVVSTEVLRPDNEGDAEPAPPAR